MAAGIVPVDKVVEDDTLLAIRDINPRAPVHVLIIPKEHIASARELTAAHSGLLSSLFTAAAAIAKQLGVFDATGLPIAGAEQAAKMRDPSLPSNELMAEAWKESDGKPL